MPVLLRYVEAQHIHKQAGCRREKQLFQKQKTMLVSCRVEKMLIRYIANMRGGIGMWRTEHISSRFAPLSWVPSSEFQLNLHHNGGDQRALESCAGASARKGPSESGGGGQVKQPCPLC